MLRQAITVVAVGIDFRLRSTRTMEVASLIIQIGMDDTFEALMVCDLRALSDDVDIQLLAGSYLVSTCCYRLGGTADLDVVLVSRNLQNIDPSVLIQVTLWAATPGRLLDDIQNSIDCLAGCLF